MAKDGSNLKMELLRFLERGGHQRDRRIGIILHYIHEDFPDSRPSHGELMEEIWSLIRQGYAYFDCSQPAASNWSLCLTDLGVEAVREGELNPYDPDGYLKRLREMVPQASDVVFQYAREGSVCFENRCYLACSVMLGVASEGAFLEMAEAFGNWLPADPAKGFLEILASPKKNYLTKFSEFRKRLEPLKSRLPSELADGMNLTLDSILDLLRIYRNEAGHPTGRVVDRDDAYTHLKLFAPYLKRMYSFRDYFLNEPRHENRQEREGRV